MTLAPGFQIGDVIAGKYRVDGVLGAGGMGVVVAARHLLLDDVVAIKFLSADLAGDAAAVSRFDREARAAARIKSEHIARVFDVDRLPSGVPYMVMEYLQGSDLSQLIDDGVLLPEALVATFVLQACAGLAEAHRAGIVHRDIKPSNLFCVGRVDRAFTIKVLDFGISKLTLTSESMKVAITGTGAAIGSPAYMSPEQMRSAASVDTLTDIWSLGVVSYELATGKLPFNGTSFPELCLKIAGDEPEPPRLHRPDMSPRLEATIAKCLQKDPKRRFATVIELAEALLPLAPASAHLLERMRATAASDQMRGFVSSPSVQVSTLPLAPPTPSAKSPITDATWTNTDLPPRAARRRMLVPIGAAVALGAALSVASIWWVRARPTPLRATAASVSARSAASEMIPVPAVASALPASEVPPAPEVSSAPSAAASASPAPRNPPDARPAPLTAPPVTPPKALPGNPSTPPSRRSKSSVWSERD